MIIIPAIDLKDGNCVRLFQGDMDQDTLYSNDPGATAAKWQELGAERLHVVDLNGAFAGKPVNAPAIEAIVKALDIPMQLGGGIRSLATMEKCFDLGIQICILGTIACRDPGLVKEACKAFPGRISVGIDARDGKVAVEGWAEVTDILAIDLAKQFEDAGVAEIIFTDISRDGALTGPNTPATKQLAQSVSIPIILSGGISSMADIEEALANAGPFANGGSISGAITGKAIYDGRVDFAKAVQLSKKGR
ncbi:MAG: 1-(5-phosphoribosyl)-5-[(5-phosphoribosylamino)methylideneamino]imidazole-4-carboxamide isomerase [Magnetococcales bacterium]|nr:1-(5-phosphoribosyl)-5-[(5-phosphoribosylamino)methylideneamino]imidazole-4-carboxamide isomerase [Magnetococcales bacterium]